MFRATRWEDGSSFHVLNLFLQPVHRAFDFDNGSRHINLLDFGTNGVGLSEHFLGQKIQCPAYGVVTGQQFTELDQVGVHSCHFFRDV